jgi:hypothetical protein
VGPTANDGSHFCCHGREHVVLDVGDARVGSGDGEELCLGAPVQDNSSLVQDVGLSLCRQKPSQ